MTSTGWRDEKQRSAWNLSIAELKYKTCVRKAEACFGLDPESPKRVAAEAQAAQAKQSLHDAAVAYRAAHPDVDDDVGGGEVAGNVCEQ